LKCITPHVWAYMWLFRLLVRDKAHIFIDDLPCLSYIYIYIEEWRNPFIILIFDHYVVLEMWPRWAYQCCSILCIFIFTLSLILESLGFLEDSLILGLGFHPLEYGNYGFEINLGLYLLKRRRINILSWKTCFSDASLLELHGVS